MNFEKHAAKGNEFLNRLAWHLNDPQNKDRAGRILRSVLRALRNRLTLEESIQLMAQLPMVVKGLYVDGWAPHKSQTKIKTIEELAWEVVREDGTSAKGDFADVDDALNAIEAVMKTMADYVSPGELHNIVAVLPEDMKGYFLTWVHTP
jgi:uncharacterized protein (DUF2267 family)